MVFNVIWINIVFTRYPKKCPCSTLSASGSLCIRHISIFIRNQSNPHLYLYPNLSVFVSDSDRKCENKYNISDIRPYSISNHTSTMPRATAAVVEARGGFQSSSRLMPWLIARGWGLRCRALLVSHNTEGETDRRESWKSGHRSGLIGLLLAWQEDLSPQHLPIWMQLTYIQPLSFRIATKLKLLAVFFWLVSYPITDAQQKWLPSLIVST